MPPRLSVAVGAVAAVACAASSAAGQGTPARNWNAPEAVALVSRAIARRTAQLADTGLTSYKAQAHGYVSFLAQLGEGFPDPPQVVRTDELAVEVYWRAPNQSKQLVVGRRDVLSRPTDIAYHRDHLAIVQNNFPAIIRIGEGDEVRDVPHPLSPAGRSLYDFAVVDSLLLRVGPRTWDVIEVEFRPRDAGQPRALGAIYVDRATASVVRFSLAFTSTALLDPSLEDISIVLDNSLVDGRFWLPRHQEIEIRRTGTWMEFPARGIIRGAWDLCCVETNLDVPPALFAGPEISFASPSVLGSYRFSGTLADSIAALAREAGADRTADLVQQRAAELVGAEALRHLATPALSARSVSDFVRFNRVEGLALGAGGVVPVRGAWALRGSGRYGVDDRLAKYSLSVEHTGGRVSLAIRTFDEYRAAGDAAEGSTLANSIAAQELGADLTDDYRSTGVAASVGGGRDVHWSATLETVREVPLTVHAQAYSGSFRPAFAADPIDAVTARVSVDHRSRGSGDMAIDWRASLEGTSDTPSGAAAGGARSTWGRAVVVVRAAREMRGGTLEASALGVATTAGMIPRQSLALFGGPVSAPGYATRSLQGRAGVSARLEWRHEVASLPLTLGRLGTSRVGLALAPYAGIARTSAATDADWHPSFGLGIVTLYDALRVDVARGAGTTGEWMVRVDFGRAFWPIL